MKKLSFLTAILFFSCCGFSQSLTGLWNGSFSNDSSTLRADQPFEIALTEYRGKVYGYSRREFIKNDTLYYVLKRVKGKIDADSCEVTEDEYISHNFPGNPDKGVKITYTFHFNKTDSTWSLDGKWKTNRVVKRKYEYYALTGKVGMVIEKNLNKSKLFPHLTELNLANDVPFYVEHKKEENRKQETQNTIAAKNQIKPQEQVIAKTEPKKKENQAPPAKETIEPKSRPDTENSKGKEESKPATVANNQVAVITKSTTGKESSKEQVQVKKETITPVENLPAKPKENVPTAPKAVAAANFEKRKLETIQSIEFQADSLLLTLYDNGEIDGDTVSILLNDEIIMAKQGLKSSAIRKTIYITPATQDSFMLALYAENLGKYPPNTGLIIVRDGEEVHQIRFSADLQKNVAVIFKRKKK